MELPGKMKDRILLKEEGVFNTYGTDFVGESEKAWRLDKYLKKMKVTIIKSSPYDLEFDLINTDAPVANTIRRILLSEVATIAIEKIQLEQNTSLIQDEVLAHRIGLIPIKADPRLFKMMESDETEMNEENSINFKLHVKCTRKHHADRDATTPEELYENCNVYSKQLIWQPIGDQLAKFQSDPPRTVDEDILIAKMRPGQEIEMLCICVKGIGRDHAKFSPVATASYRLLPEITLQQEIVGEAAQRLKESFSDGVIELEEQPDGSVAARVVDARMDTCSRNIFRHPDLAEQVVLTRKRRHFIFSVESTGALTSATLVIQSLQVLQEKCRTVREALDKL